MWSDIELDGRKLRCSLSHAYWHTCLVCDAVIIFGLNRVIIIKRSGRYLHSGLSRSWKPRLLEQEE